MGGTCSTSDDRRLALLVRPRRRWEDNIQMDFSRNGTGFLWLGGQLTTSYECGKEPSGSIS